MENKKVKFTIELRDDCVYEVEAENSKEAIETALEWWSERMPFAEITVSPIGVEGR